MSSKWTATLISDDEDELQLVQKYANEEPQKVPTIKKRGRPKTNSKISQDLSIILISDDEDQISKKTSKTRNLPNRRVINDMISDDEDDDKKKTKINVPQRKAVKRKTVPDGDLKFDNLTESYVPKNKLVKTECDEVKKDVCDNSETFWKEHELLADRMNLNENTSKNIIKLLTDGNTIPFIARYRREATGNMTPEVLREVKSAFEEICELKHKIKSVVTTLKKTENYTEYLEKAVKCSKSLEELEITYAPFKPEGKRTLAERARVVGLEQPAMDLLLNSTAVNLNKYINKSKEELIDVSNIEKGIVHIIAQKMATDFDVLSFLRDLRKNVHFTVETKKLKSKLTSNSKTQQKKPIGEKSLDESKFENYFDFRMLVRHIKPHQVLAINRGEHHKILSVKIVIPDFVFNTFHQFCFQKWINHGLNNQSRRAIIEEAVKDSYNRLVQPFMVREIRSELKLMAQKASYDVFSKNLKHILLAAPIKGQTILGIDPGYSHGCKIAVISSMGMVLDHCFIYPHSSSMKRESAKKVLIQLLETYDCSLISLGDGTASKETEQWITELIKNKYFHPRDVKYTIVSEDGASIYSCSPEAKKEFGDMDTNIISAVSLARRIQDPMAELVKVEPQHLGVGMYQHDLKKKTLDEALNEVVSECVSFVGVDLNTASQALLRRIAGLTDKRATEIVKYRENNGPFIYRKQLTEVSGIGPKVFQQCAGFLRVGPINAASTTDFYKNPNTTMLDQTYIHPESYKITMKLLKHLKLSIADIGQNNFINQIKTCASNFAKIQETIGTTKEDLNLIFDALSKPLNYDLRTEISQAAFFSTGLKSVDDLNIGSKVMGRIKNVTHFGCFVDIGLGKDALIHSSKLGHFNLQIGDRVEGVVCMIDKVRQRFNVEPIAKL